MNRFFIITNEERDEDLSVTRRIQDYIAAKGGESSYYVSQKTEWSNRSLHRLKAKDLNAECILVLGGDGTLVRSARELADTGIPLIGVNLGTVGYLCELDLENVFSAIDQIMQGSYEVERRMMIKGIMPAAECGSETDGSGEAQSGAGDGRQADPADGRQTDAGDEDLSLALNDIVIHRAGSAQLINLVLTVNGEYLATYSADGMILSTPTGSTGYSMSAGGPIVDPKTKLLLITPINPHTISARSIVVGADARIEVTLAKRRTEMDEEAEVTFDGDRMLHMKVGDRILVQKADVCAQIMRIDQLSFLQILRKKIT